jgi:hypothetical protein
MSWVDDPLIPNSRMRTILQFHSKYIEGRCLRRRGNRNKEYQSIETWQVFKDIVWVIYTTNLEKNDCSATQNVRVW